MINTEWISTLSDFLKERGLEYDDTIDAKVKARKAGKAFSFSEHLQAMIYSMLSAQRPWADVVPHLPEIDEIFCQYDADQILSLPYTYFIDRIQDIKCGNRNIKRQMQQLPDNIETFRSLEATYGSMDAYVTSAPAYMIVADLSTGMHKLHNMREALCWEYIRNVRIDGAKPDVHLRRFLGSDRVGTGNHPTATVQEVGTTIQQLSEASGMSMATIDNIIWAFCSVGYGEICGAEPRCHQCPICEHCSTGRNL